MINLKDKCGKLSLYGRNHPYKMSLDAPLKGIFINIYEVNIPRERYHEIWELLYAPGVDSSITLEQDILKIIVRSWHLIAELSAMSIRDDYESYISGITALGYMKEVYYPGCFQPIRWNHGCHGRTINLLGVNFTCYKGDNFIPSFELFGPDETVIFTKVKKKKVNDHSGKSLYTIDCKKKRIDIPHNWSFKVKFDGYKIPEYIPYILFYSYPFR